MLKGNLDAETRDPPMKHTKKRPKILGSDCLTTELTE